MGFWDMVKLVGESLVGGVVVWLCGVCWMLSV